MGMLGVWHRVRVSGQSMTPTLRDGDIVLVRSGAVIRPGDIVLARFRGGFDMLVLKRAVRAQDGGWVLASDNARAGSDSAQYGVADVQARVCWIWQRRLRGGRRGPRTLVRTVLGHRPHRQPPDGL
jgi:phage repressor protein C with HTH and peptisase S24 domain